jgi:hypothetical protein
MRHLLFHLHLRAPRLRNVRRLQAPPLTEFPASVLEGLIGDVIGYIFDDAGSIIEEV